MPHPLRALAIVIVFLGASHGLSGQAPDTRLDDAVKEIALLRRMMADQDRRLATLESTVRTQQRCDPSRCPAPGRCGTFLENP